MKNVSRYRRVTTSDMLSVNVESTVVHTVHCFTDRPFVDACKLNLMISNNSSCQADTAPLSEHFLCNLGTHASCAWVARAATHAGLLLM